MIDTPGITNKQAGGITDASQLTYTPGDVTDWAGGVDPGNGDDAFDQLADRVNTLEGAPAGGDSTYTGTEAATPAPSNDGDLYLPNNGFYLKRDTGAVWQPWGPLFPMTPPISGDFSWVNQGGASIDTTYGGIYLLAPGAAGNNIRARVKATPGTPFTVTICCIPQMKLSSTNCCGLVIQESGTGKLITFARYGDSVGGGLLHIFNWSSPTAYAGSYFNAGRSPVSPLFLRYTDDGANRLYSWSADGQHFEQVFTHVNNTYLVADRIGFFADAEDVTFPTAITLLSWKES